MTDLKGRGGTTLRGSSKTELIWYRWFSHKFEQIYQPTLLTSSKRKKAFLVLHEFSAVTRQESRRIEFVGIVPIVRISVHRPRIQQNDRAFWYEVVANEGVFLYPAQ